MRGRNRLIVSGVVYDLTPEIAEGLFSCYQNLKRKHGRRKRLVQQDEHGGREMTIREYRKLVRAWEAWKADEGLTTARAWLAARPAYRRLGAAAVERRALEISGAAGLYAGESREGELVMTGRAIRMAAEAEAGRGAAHRAADRRAARAAGGGASYEDILLLFKARGASFSGWCRRMGFDERQARRAVARPRRKCAQYARIRAALAATLRELRG